MDEDAFIATHTVIQSMVRSMFESGRFEEIHYCHEMISPSPEHSPIRRRSYSPDEWRKGEVDLPPYERFPGNINNYYEEADKNARELIQEEEESKLRVEKKRAKKERQKQKKKNMNQIPDQNSTGASTNSRNEVPTNEITNSLENMTSNNDIQDTEGLDIDAAFMSKAITKVKHFQIIPVKTKGKKEVRNLHTVLIKAQDFENKQNFKEANRYYSEAIDLAPKRPDIILRRSHIYYLLKRFEKSIRDAQQALVYSPNNPEAHFRIGESNFALKNLSEAEAAFSKILNHNSYCDLAKERLFSIRINQLEEMGYHPNEAFTALFKSTNKTLDEAVEYLTNLENGKVTTEDLYYSDDEESDEDYDDKEDMYYSDDKESYEESDKDDKDFDNKTPVAEAEIKSVPSFDISNNHPLVTDHTNPLKICSLFIGDLKQEITEKEMTNVFIKFGDLSDIRVLKRQMRWCAFVNYVSAASAGQAMQALQNSRWLLSTKPLIVKYPTNTVTTALASLENPQTFLSQYKTYCRQQPRPGLRTKPVVLPPPPNKSDKVARRLLPPPKSAECFYWRNYGCNFRNKCFYLHIPANKGIDCKGRRPVPKPQQEESWD